MGTKPVYRRVVLKISGEAFGSKDAGGVDPVEVSALARRAQRVAASGVELAIVVGGGNIVRGAAFSEHGVVGRAAADYMGMLATVINGLALQDSLEHLGCDTRLQTAIRMEGVAEPYIRRRCIRHLEKGRVVLLAGGTGNPFFTTDTTAALRAMEIEADVLLKATKVDGIYAADPATHPDAERFVRLTYDDALQRKLRVMDLTALSMCMDHHMPIIVLNMKVDGNIERAICGEAVGTLVGDDQT